jgi:ABC-type xylose transport system permease subunit
LMGDGIHGLLLRDGVDLSVSCTATRRGSWGRQIFLLAATNRAARISGTRPIATLSKWSSSTLRARRT